MNTKVSKGRKLVGTVLTAAFLLFGAQHVSAQCEDVKENISTGIDDYGNILTPGTTDPHWVNTQGAGNVISTYSGWSTLSGSAWLGLNSGSSNTDYYYTRTFNATSSGSISFQSLADNYVVITLDGVQIVQTPGLNIYGFQTAYGANYSGTFSAGTHTLLATVHNESSATGFNLSGSVVYSATPTSIDISTGTSGGSILSPGVTDPNWQNANGYNVVTAPNAGWANLSGAAWLGVNNYSTVPSGNFYFTRNFTTAGTGTISFDALADNNVSIYLDGTLLGQTPGSSIYGFLLGNKVTYSGSVSAGSHILSANVYNESGPIGFDLAGKVTYCGTVASSECQIDPSFTAYYVSYNTAGFNSSSNPVNTPGVNEVVDHYWDFGDGGTSTAVNPVYTYGAPGTYTVTHTIVKYIYDSKGNLLTACKQKKVCSLTITNGFIIEPIDADAAAQRPPVDGGSVTLNCKDIISQEKRILAQQQTAGEIAIYPNPATDKLSFKGNGRPFSIHVMSLDGRTVMSVNDLSDNAAISINSLVPGSYIIRVSQDGSLKNLRFTKLQ